MSVYIKGMKMPTSCNSCRFCGRGGLRNERVVCMFTGANAYMNEVQYLDGCPLISVPEHGDLIDRVAFREEIDKHYPFDMYTQSKHEWEDSAKSAIIRMLATAPTIIPASKEGEG